MENLTDHLSGLTEIHETEYRLRCRDGSWRWVLSRGKVMEWTPLHEPLRIAGTHLDIHDRKNAELQNQRLQEKIIRAQKLEAVGRLAGGIAHDFNNVLSIISAQAELGIRKTERTGNDPDDFRNILSATERASGLVKQLLAFSRKQRIDPVIVHPGSVISNIETMLRRLIDEDILLEITIDTGLPFIMADPTQIEQICINLVVNARDAIRERKEQTVPMTITLHVRETFLDESFHSRFLNSGPGRFIEIRVQDTGTGISADSLNNIFEPFYSTKEDGRGTGLGLSTVYGILEENSGCINVETAETIGTTFSIYWPVSDETAMISPELSGSAGEEKGSGTIILAEDDENFRTLVTTFLSQMGYRVLTAENGETAWLLVNDHGTAIDLVITDMIMPVMNGRKLWQKTTERFPSLPFIFMSGYSDEIIPKGSGPGKTVFLKKPFPLRSLAHEIGVILSR